MSDPAREVVDRFYAAMAAGDGGTVLGLLAPDISWTEAAGFPYAGTYVGPEAVAANVFARLGEEWEGFAAVPDLVVADSDQVVARGWYSGTYKATGIAFRARYVHWFTVQDGHLTTFEQITDTAMVTPALG